jgi:AcrR family transcriptional regulator
MSSPEQTNPRGEATRQAILNAAEKLFMAQGYNGTSMRQIADGAGDIAVSGIYNHYKSKEEIFRALLELRSPYPKVIGILESIPDGTGPQMLEYAFRTMTDMFGQHRDFVRLVAIDIQEHNAETVVSLVSIVLPHAIQFFLRVKAAGGIREDVEVFAIARSFISFLLGFNLTAFVLFRSDAPRLITPILPADLDWLSYCIDVFINGVAEHRENRERSEGQE